jgi:Tannase and feruloyl esterase
MVDIAIDNNKQGDTMDSKKPLSCDLTALPVALPLAFCLLLTLVACVSQPTAPVAPPLTLAPKNACATLVGGIAATAIGLPSGAATIRSAQMQDAALLRTQDNAPTPAAGVIPATPAYCRVQGHIAPLDPSAPNIEFQINLPQIWNGRTVQYGGGGFNGVLINGLSLVPAAPYDQPIPLAKGYVTYGTDSGHQNKPNTPPQVFALNDESLTNFAFASYKKVRDVAVEMTKRYYGQAPAKLYFVGSSEGGREGILIAQKYPNDFDGVFSRVPVLNWMGLQMFGTRSGVSLMGSNWINPNKARLVAKAVVATCDLLDGAADGLISDYEGCLKRFDPTALRCAGGGEGGDQCLSDGQINAVKGLHSPLQYASPLENGVTSYPGYGIGGEGLEGIGPTGGWISWWSGRSAPTVPAAPSNSITWFYGAGAMQYLIAKDPNYDPSKFTPTSFAERVRYISTIMDVTDPDLSVFHARGGKLIIKEHMADYAQSPYAGINYYKSVVAKLGQAKVNDFVRLFVAPGVDHVGYGGPANVDMLELLSNWVEQGRAPGSAAPLVHVEQDPKPPFAVKRARPMCEYPKFPRYRGGDMDVAGSFSCE